MFKFISALISILIICFISLTLNIFISICNSSEYKANIKSKDSQARKHYIEKLAEKTNITHEDTIIVVEALYDKSDIVWLSAIATIEKIYPQGQLNISSLIKLLHDKSVKPEKKYYIIQILNLYKDKSDIFIDDLLNILKDNKTPVLIRIQIIDLFGNLGNKSKNVRSNLLKLAKENENELIRFKAWKSLSILEPNNDEAIAKIAEKAESKSSETLTSNAGAIHRSFYPTLDAVTTLVDLEKFDIVLPIILELLNSPSDELRPIAASILLLKIGSKAESYLPQIIEEINKDPFKSDSLAIYYIIPLLSKLDDPNGLSFKTLSNLSKNATKPIIREFATENLVSMKVRRGDKSAIPYLKKYFKDVTIEYLKLGAASKLLSLGAEDKLYLDYINKRAINALNSKIPYPVLYDENGRAIEGKYSQEFIQWCEKNNCEKDKMATQAELAIPIPVLFLAASGDKRAYDILIQGLKSRNHNIVIYSAQGLAKINDDRAIPFIIGASQKTPKEVSEKVAINLVYFQNSEEAQSALNKFIDDPKRLKEIKKEAVEKGIEGIFGF